MKKIFAPLSKILHACYQWALRLASKPYAVWGLFFLAFIESSFFPIPPDVLLVALAMGAHKRSFFFALVCTIGSTLGGLFGYWIGYALFDPVATPIIELLHLQNHMGTAKTWLNDYGVWVVMIAGFTPIPYKVFTIASGWAHMDLLTFTVASVLSRGARFYLVAGLFYYMGPAAKTFIDKHFESIVIGVTLLTVIAVAAVKLLA